MPLRPVQYQTAVLENDTATALTTLKQLELVKYNKDGLIRRVGAKSKVNIYSDNQYLMNGFLANLESIDKNRKGDHAGTLDMYAEARVEVSARWAAGTVSTETYRNVNKILLGNMSETLQKAKNFWKEGQFGSEGYSTSKQRDWEGKVQNNKLNSSIALLRVASAAFNSSSLIRDNPELQSRIISEAFTMLDQADVEALFAVSDRDVDKPGAFIKHQKNNLTSVVKTMYQNTMMYANPSVFNVENKGKPVSATDPATGKLIRFDANWKRIKD